MNKSVVLLFGGLMKSKGSLLPVIYKGTRFFDGLDAECTILVFSIQLFRAALTLRFLHLLARRQRDT